MRINEFGCVAYMNSGFFALSLPRDELFLNQWHHAMELCLSGAGGLFETPYFPMPDQDCMNAVLANLDLSFATWVRLTSGTGRKWLILTFMLAQLRSQYCCIVREG